MTADGKIYPWEMTLDEWLGPKPLVNVPIPPSHGEGVLRAARSFGGLRVQIGDVWVEHVPSETGSLIYTTADSQDVRGMMFSKKFWIIAPELRGTGIAGRAVSDFYYSYGRPHREILDHSINSPITVDGGRALTRIHTLCVQRAVSEGVQVQQCVLDSIVDSRERVDALRAGCNSALRLADDRTRRRLRSTLGKRFACLKLRASFIERLPNNFQRRALERLVVVAD